MEKLNHFKNKILSNKLFIIVALFVLFFIICVTLIIPKLTPRIIKSAVEKNCSTCKLDIGKITTSFFKPGIMFSFEKVHFIGGEKDCSEIVAHAEKVTATLSILQFFLGRVYFHEIQVEKPHVTLIDGDKLSTPSQEHESFSPLLSVFRFQILKTAVHQGTFVYTNKSKNKVANLTVNNIDANINELGTVSSLIHKEAQGQAFARLENSGEVDFRLNSYLFSAPLRVQLDIKVKNQNLSDLNTFLKTSEGVSVLGQLVDGHAQVNIYENTLKSSVVAKYHGLKVKIEKTEERNKFVVFLANLGSKLAIRSGNIHKSNENKNKPVEMSRREHESLITFIIRGLRDAAIKVL